jgi:squalene-hopene/tetraprenyl-beta-curcumene cyclase
LRRGAAAIETRERLAERLLAARVEGGHWVGELSSSALATATAVGALALAEREGAPAPGGSDVIARGRAWLARNRNPDGGWGDTVRSASNIAATALVWGAFGLARPVDTEEVEASASAERWIRRLAGGIDAGHLHAALADRYGKDRTFSAPIFAFLSASGRLGEEGWTHVAALPFELALVPPAFLGAVRLPVVSYALPALVAIGQLRHHRRPSRNPLARAVRDRAREPTLRMLPVLQPASGGYLEAVPLTSFVVLSLLAAARTGHEVVRRGLKFLVQSARPDGSWPVDTDLATWVTTLSVVALGADALTEGDRSRLREWILSCQHRDVHPYTRAAAGGWAWTDRSGGVPDADDTASALLALAVLGGEAASRAAAASGVDWLIGLQNRDGGIPTFCRGWGALPFDRSSPDLTAHALRAWAAWRPHLAPHRQAAVGRALDRAVRYLQRAQCPDGSWVPLWFGDEGAPGEINPVYGTARVLPALAAVAAERPLAEALRARGREWLLRAQNRDGGWGGAPGLASSLEQTALAVSAIAVPAPAGAATRTGPAEDALQRGIAWIVERTDRGRDTPASPIGLYFARLWYFEALYPLIFAAAAMRAADPGTAGGSRDGD